MQDKGVHGIQRCDGTTKPLAKGNQPEDSSVGESLVESEHQREIAVKQTLDKLVAIAADESTDADTDLLPHREPA